MDCICFLVTSFFDLLDSILSLCVMVEVKMAALIAVSDHLLSDNTFGSSCPKYSDPDNVPTTAAGEVELESSGQRSSQDFTHRQISGWTQIDTFEGIDPQKIDQIQWQDAEIPKELELIQAGTPVEICRIIKASLDNHRGIKASPVDRGASERRDSGNDMQVVDLELDPSAAHDSTSQPRSTRSTSGASDSSAGSSSKASETSTSRFSVSTASSVDSGTECNSQTLSEKRTPGQPKVTIGPLGWIITYEDGEKPKSWWRRHKEPKKPKETHNQTKPIPRGHREDG